MDNKIEFRLVSPEKKLFEEPVALAVMPGMDGEFGVGTGHTSLVASLKLGVVELYAASQSDQPQRIFITGGFADVTNTSCVVLAEEAVNVNDLDGDALSKDFARLQDDLKLAVEPADTLRLQTSIDITAAKIEAVTGKAVSRY